MQIESILSPSLLEIQIEITERTKDGWEPDPNRLLCQIGWQYECGFIKYTEEEKAVNKLKEDAFPTEAAKKPRGRPKQS